MNKASKIRSIMTCKKCRSTNVTLQDVSDGFVEYFALENNKLFGIDKQMGDYSHSYLKCNYCGKSRRIRHSTWKNIQELGY